jgi:hypothetical protein
MADYSSGQNCLKWFRFSRMPSASPMRVLAWIVKSRGLGISCSLNSAGCITLIAMQKDGHDGKKRGSYDSYFRVDGSSLDTVENCDFVDEACSWTIKLSTKISVHIQ